MGVIEKIRDLLTRINSVTGEADDTLNAAADSLIAGYGGVYKLNVYIPFAAYFPSGSNPQYLSIYNSSSTFKLYLRKVKKMRVEGGANGIIKYSISGTYKSLNVEVTAIGVKRDGSKTTIFRGTNISSFMGKEYDVSQYSYIEFFGTVMNVSDTSGSALTGIRKEMSYVAVRML